MGGYPPHDRSCTYMHLSYPDKHIYITYITCNRENPSLTPQQNFLHAGDHVHLGPGVCITLQMIPYTPTTHLSKDSINQTEPKGNRHARHEPSRRPPRSTTYRSDLPIPLPRVRLPPHPSIPTPSSLPPPLHTPSPIHPSTPTPTQTPPTPQN